MVEVAVPEVVLVEVLLLLATAGLLLDVDLPLVEAGAEFGKGVSRMAATNPVPADRKTILDPSAFGDCK